MNINRERILASLRDSEGFRDTAYQDTMDVPTIGYGHTKGVRKGDTCTREEAELMLLQDLNDAVHDVDRCLPWVKELPQVAQESLVDACFNLGITRLLRFEKMLNACKARSWAEAVYEAWNSRWAKQVPRRVRHVTKGFVLADVDG